MRAHAAALLIDRWRPGDTGDERAPVTRRLMIVPGKLPWSARDGVGAGGRT